MAVSNVLKTQRKSGELCLGRLFNLIRILTNLTFSTVRAHFIGYFFELVGIGITKFVRQEKPLLTSLRGLRHEISTTYSCFKVFNKTV